MVATVSTTVLESYRFIQAPGTQSIIVTQTEVNGQFQAVYYSGQPITIPPDHLILGATTLKGIERRLFNDRFFAEFRLRYRSRA